MTEPPESTPQDRTASQADDRGKPNAPIAPGQPDEPTDADEGCRVVMYHYVRDRRPPISEGVRGLSVEAFERQIDSLTQSAEPIDWQTLRAFLTDGTPIPRRSLLLTFDDGLLDHAEIVAPILDARGLSGVFFVPGCVLTSRRLLPAHQVHLLLSALGTNGLLAAVEHRLRTLDPATDWLARADTNQANATYHYESPARAVLKHLLTTVLPVDLRNEVLDRVVWDHLGRQEDWADRWYLTCDHVRALDAGSHTIGGHGFSHEPLTRMESDAARRDLRRGADALTDLLGPAERPMSYPFGRFSPDLHAAIRQAGFVHAFTTHAVTVRAGADPFALPRYDTIALNHHRPEETPCPAC